MIASPAQIEVALAIMETLAVMDGFTVIVIGEETADEGDKHGVALDVI